MCAIVFFVEQVFARLDISAARNLGNGNLSILEQYSQILKDINLAVY